MARPSKFSPERVTAITDALRVGNTRTAAVRAAEVSLDSLARWMDANAEFRGAVEKAEADAEQRFLGTVSRAAEKTWQAAAWWLERRRFAEYRQRSGMELSGAGGGPVQVQTLALEDHEKAVLRDVILEELARRSRVEAEA